MLTIQQLFFKWKHYIEYNKMNLKNWKGGGGGVVVVFHSRQNKEVHSNKRLWPALRTGRAGGRHVQKLHQVVFPPERRDFSPPGGGCNYGVIHRVKEEWRRCPLRYFFSSSCASHVPFKTAWTSTYFIIHI